MMKKGYHDILRFSHESLFIYTLLLMHPPMLKRCVHNFVQNITSHAIFNKNQVIGKKQIDMLVKAYVHEG